MADCSTAAQIAEHYRPGAKPSNGYFRIPCPAHGGKGQNLAVAEGNDGGLVLKCHSEGCSYNAILAQFRADGLLIERRWTYPNGKAVNRTDNADGKSITSPGTTKAVPILIRGDVGDDHLVVITEGESDADAVLSANIPEVAAACFVGGADRAGDADYSAVQGRRVAVWTDHDKAGMAAREAAAQACTDAGARSVEVIRFVGQPGSGMGAADCTADMLDLYLDTRTPWEPPAPAPAGYDWRWRDVGTFVDVEPPAAVISGLLYEGGITLLHAGIKVGKSTLLWALIRSLSPHGPQFCGLDLPDMRCLIFTEEPPAIVGERARYFGIPTGWHQANEAAALTMPPDDFAQSAYTAYHQLGGEFGLVVIDTVGSFLNCQDFNSYSEGGKVMQPLRQLVRQLPGAAMLLLHHDNKGSTTDGHGRALGSTKFGGDADQLVHLQKRDGRRQLTVGGRYPVAPFEYDKAFIVDIGAGGVSIVGTPADACADDVGKLLTTYTEPATIKAIAGDLGGTYTDKNIRDALAAMVADGEVRIVEKGRGNRPSTYSLVSLND